MDNTMNEAAVLRTLRAMINDEINKRIAVITDASESKIEIEDYRSDIDEMIRDYINYNVTVTLDC